MSIAGKDESESSDSSSSDKLIIKQNDTYVKLVIKCELTAVIRNSSDNTKDNTINEDDDQSDAYNPYAIYHNPKISAKEEDKIDNSNRPWYDKEYFIDSSLPFFERYQFLIILVSITSVLFLIEIIVAGTTSKQGKYCIPERSLRVIPLWAIYIIWVIHCLYLCFMPIHMALILRHVNMITLCFPTSFMVLNFIATFMPSSFTWFFTLIETILIVIFLRIVPIKSAVIPAWKDKDFYSTELFFMGVSWVFFGAAIPASGLSLFMFRSFLAFDGTKINFPADPALAVDLYKEVISYGENLFGAYLAIFSLFFFFGVFHGFLMTFRNSPFMIIPHFFLAFFAFFSSTTAGVIFLLQCCIYAIYFCSLQFKESREWLSNPMKFCGLSFDSDSYGLMLIAIGDILAMFMFAIPMLAMAGLYTVGGSLNWLYFIIASFIVVFGCVAHFWNQYSVGGDEIVMTIIAIIAVALISAGGFVFGMAFKGDFQFIRATTYEMTYLMWSMTLSLVCLINGYSPLLFRIYNTLISLSVYFIIAAYDGFGWIEVILLIAQIIVDSILLGILCTKETPPTYWIVFAISAIVLFSIIAVIATIIFMAVCIIVLKIIGACLHHESPYEYAKRMNLKPGDEFELDGTKYKVGEEN